VWEGVWEGAVRVMQACTRVEGEGWEGWEGWAGQEQGTQNKVPRLSTWSCMKGTGT
jgi:hypothetical protein